jgi:hypothetical protein
MYYTIASDALAEVHDLAVDMQPKKNGLPVLRRACCR